MHDSVHSSFPQSVLGVALFSLGVLLIRLATTTTQSLTILRISAAEELRSHYRVVQPTIVMHNTCVVKAKQF